MNLMSASRIPFAPLPILPDLAATALTRMPRSTSIRPLGMWTGRIEDRQFVLMQQAFSAHGGVATAEEVLRRMRRHFEQPLSQLAKWIVQRDALNFEWRGQILLPLFQFEDFDMTLDENIMEITKDLLPGCDDWEVCLWYAMPCHLLNGSAPVELVLLDPERVHGAARADRFSSHA